ncbi:MAG: endonuclease/exonuclease/phosphatase family protein [Gemmatimonadaceae bacterium]
MRLVAWNCCTGPRGRKLDALESLGADIAVVPECPELPITRGATFWVGENSRKGLAIFARKPWRITPVRVPAPMPRYLQPLQVSGPEKFVLWAVWPQQGSEPRHRYVRAVHHALDVCPALFGKRPTVILGDLNSNTTWDHLYPKDRNHSALIRRLSELGIASAYHAQYGEAHGSESRPTFFEYRHAHRPYHIDFCFVPAAWLGRIDAVTVGTHADWARLSDHMPVITDVRTAAT